MDYADISSKPSIYCLLTSICSFHTSLLFCGAVGNGLTTNTTLITEFVFDSQISKLRKVNNSRIVLTNSLQDICYSLPLLCTGGFINSRNVLPSMIKQTFYRVFSELNNHIGIYYHLNIVGIIFLDNKSFSYIVPSCLTFHDRNMSVS